MVKCPEKTTRTKEQIVRYSEQTDVTTATAANTAT